MIATVKDAEPIGPKKLLDLLIIAPCTGNTLGKLAGWVTDTSVTMAAKAHLRNDRPVLIAPSTNDGLAGYAANLGALMGRKNLYFVVRLGVLVGSIAIVIAAAVLIEVIAGKVAKARKTDCV